MGLLKTKRKNIKEEKKNEKNEDVKTGKMGNINARWKIDKNAK